MVSINYLAARIKAVKRQGAVQASNPLEAATASQPAQALEATAATNTSPYLGIGLGVGGALLLACVVVIVQIVRKRIEHRRQLAELEQGHTIQVAQAQNVRCEMPRPISFARVGRFVPIHGKSGWGALGSNEEINDTERGLQPAQERRSYVSLPRRIKQQGVPLRRLKHLSAIIESPRSRSANSPTPEIEILPELPSPKNHPRQPANNAVGGEHQGLDGKIDARSSSPKPGILPSFAIGSPSRYGAILVEGSPKPKRTHSLGGLITPITNDDVFAQGNGDGRPPMHARSISLGAQRAANQPPAGPVPPLPVIAPHNVQIDRARSGFCLSRISNSSLESTSSSVLITSPILRGAEPNMPSPSLEQMVAEDSDASLKTVSQRTWQNPLIAGPRPIPDTSPTVPASAIGGHQRKPSIRSNIARYSADSQLSRQLSTNSMASSLEESGNNRLSIPRLGTADRVSIRSVSSVTSLRSDTAVKKIITPRKVSRCSTTVSENGSPAERQKINVLRDISGNACTPSRQPSNATQFSSRSSNGNPFQWDSVPLQKPSALKGSPNARKGHRRQNCVRISTLTPQILGPPPSRPTSPSIMHGIEEEPLDASSDNFMGGLPFVSNQSRLSRPPSATVFAPHLRISTLRASLTSASPVLSSWTTFQEPGIASQPSDSALSASASSGFTGNRSGSRHSGQSSNLSIPSFPSPSKTTVTAVQRDQPVPEFHFTRPSTDEPSFDFGWDRGSPPRIDGSVADNADLPSSPPLPVSKVEEYDPAWPIIDAPRRDGSHEYDPASPTFAQSPKDTDHTSPLASTVTFSDDTARYSRPVSYGDECQPESPPCSPKTVPQGFDNLLPSTPASRSGSSTPRIDFSNEPLTSANASTIMARIQTHRPNVTFPGAPILPPPIDDNPVPFPLNTARNRSLSTHSTYLQPQRPAPAPRIPPALLPGPQKPPSPVGPRSPPAKSLAKQIVALRRMNSEMDASTSHQTRRYVHGLAREPSPLLPWIGSPDPSESCNDMFDFDFGRDARGGAEEAGEGEVGEDEAPASALDNVDLSDIERRLEGALAGFEVPVAVEEQEQERGEGECKSPVWAQGCGGEEEDEDERSSSVWEDGEKFWDRTSLSTIPGSSPSDADKARAVIQTPRMYAIENHGFGSRRARMRSPSVMVTPRSLYDADGFLKT